MPYVKRDEQGEVVSVYARPQPGFAEEHLSEAHADMIAFRLEATTKLKKEQLKQEMYRVLAEGFDWKAANPDPWFNICVDADMQGFLTRTLLKLNEGRISPHGGFIRSNGVSTAIDDTGMRELCIFAGTWGDALSAIRIQTEEAVVDWDAFDPYTIDWTVTWTGADAANGWADNTLTQAP